MRRGFTLIEVLIAVALLSLLTGSMFAFLVNLARTRDRTLSVSRVESGATLFLDRLEDDLGACIAGDASFGPGVRGTADSIEVLRRLVTVEGAEVDPARAVLGVYRHDPVARTIETIDPDTGEGEVLGTGVVRLAMRYHDGSQWLDSFDSSRSGLPVAVEVSLWLGDPAAPGETTDAIPEFGALEAPMQPELGETSPESLHPDRVRIIAVPDGPVAAWKDRS